MFEGIEFLNKGFFWLLLLLPVAIVWYYFKNKQQTAELKISSLKGFKVSNSWLPKLKHLLFALRLFALTALIFSLCFGGIALSFFPYIVPGTLTIWDAVAAPQSLNFLLWGAMIVIPTIILYTAYSYRVFWGKVSPLQYY